MAVINSGEGISTYASTDTVRQAIQNQMNTMKWDGSAPIDSLANTTDYFIRTFGVGTGVSSQEIAGMITDAYHYNGIPDTGFQPTQSDPYSAPATSGTSTATQQATIAEANAKRAAAMAQYEPLFAQYMAELQSSTGTAKTKLTEQKDRTLGDYKKGYDDNAQLNDTRYGEGLQNIQRGYAARGIGDSSYKENAQSGLTSDFNRVYGGMTDEYKRNVDDTGKQYTEGIASYDKQLTDRTAAANASRNNLLNPNSPQFTDFSSAGSYISGLDTNIANAKATIANTNLSNANIAANPAGNDKMFQEWAGAQTGIGSDQAARPWGDVAGEMKQRGQTDPSYDAYLSYLYGGKEGDSYKYMNPTKSKYLY